MNKNLIKIVSGLVGGVGLATLLLFATPALASDGALTISNSPTSATVVQGMSTPTVTVTFRLNFYTNIIGAMKITGCPPKASCYGTTSMADPALAGFIFVREIVPNFNYTPWVYIKTASDTPTGNYRVYITLSEYSNDECQSSNHGSPCLHPVTSYIDVTVNAPAPTCKAPTTGSMTGPSSVNINTSFEIGCDYGSNKDYINGPAGFTFVRYDVTAAIFSGTSPSSAQSKTYTCSTANPGSPFTNWCTLPASVSKTITILGPSTADIKANGSNGPVSISYNTAATISWTSTNATSCTTSPNIGTATSNSGVSTGNLTTNKTYSITCTGAGGTDTDTVSVNTGTPPVPTVDIKADGSNGPVSILYNAASTLSWTSTQASSCSVTNGSWTDTVNTGVSTGSLTSSKTYTITCTGPGGSANDSVVVNVTAQPVPVVTLTANPQGGIKPFDSTLTWTTTNSPTSCTASDGWSGAKTTTGGTQALSNIQNTATYTITCTNSGGGGTASVSITATTANAAPAAPTITGATTGSTGSSYTFTVSSTDPESNQIRYGIDWNMDGVADLWVPAGVTYVPSGTSQTGSNTWNTTGTKKFQALAQDAPGLNSGWTSYSIVISNPVLPPTVTVSQSGGGGGPINITWTTSNDPTSCTASGAWSGSKDPAGGSQTFASSATSQTYSITCTNSAGSTPPVSITVTPVVVYSLSVIKTYGGSVKAGDNLINCGPTCANNYTSGTNVTLTAYPDSAQWKFIGWQGACTGTGTCSVNVNGVKTVTAQFALKPLIYQEF